MGIAAVRPRQLSAIAAGASGLGTLKSKLSKPKGLGPVLYRTQALVDGLKLPKYLGQLMLGFLYGER